MPHRQGEPIWLCPRHLRRCVCEEGRTSSASTLLVGGAKLRAGTAASSKCHSAHNVSRVEHAIPRMVRRLPSVTSVTKKVSERLGVHRSLAQPILVWPSAGMERERAGTWGSEDPEPTGRESGGRDSRGRGRFSVRRSSTPQTMVSQDSLEDARAQH